MSQVLKLTCMLNCTNMKPYKFYQDCAVKVKVESAQNSYLEGNKNENLDFKFRKTKCGRKENQ